MNIIEPPSKRYIAERIHVMARSHLARSAIMLSRTNVESLIDIATDEMIMSLDSYVHGMTSERIVVHRKWPKDWWQAVKERFAPAWFTRRWPVVYDRLDIDKQLYAAVCPHICDDKQGRHLEWMSAKFDEAKELSCH
jgi:hypothetical protein